LGLVDGSVTTVLLPLWIYAMSLMTLSIRQLSRGTPTNCPIGGRSTLGLLYVNWRLFSGGPADACLQRDQRQLACRQQARHAGVHGAASRWVTFPYSLVLWTVCYPYKSEAMFWEWMGSVTRRGNFHFLTRGAVWLGSAFIVAEQCPRLLRKLKSTNIGCKVSPKVNKKPLVRPVCFLKGPKLIAPQCYFQKGPILV
jgi:hypothetical protein